MQIVLIDPFDNQLPPPFGGNLERLWYGIMCGKGNNLITMMSCRKSYVDVPSIDGIYRPNHMSDVKRFVSSSDLVIMPANIDWYVGGVKHEFNSCLRELCSVAKVAVVGQLTTDLDVCALVRSKTEAQNTKAKRVKIIRHCSPIKKSSVPIDDRVVVMIGGITQWGIEVAANACRLNKQQLFVIGKHNFESIYGAVMLGEISEAQKVDLITQASHCIYLRHQNQKPVGSPSLIEPGLCGTPTIAIDYDDFSAVSEYLDDAVVVNKNANTADVTRLVCAALREKNVSRLKLRQQMNDLYSCGVFVRNVIDAVFDDVSMFDS